MNIVILMGRLTKDPEMKSTNSGKSVCNFIIAVDKYSGGEKKADFIKCTAWEKNAETISQYLHKGSMISIEGRISTSILEGTDGKKTYSTDVTVGKVHFCEKKSETAVSGNNYPGDASPDMGADDDVPF